MVLAVPPPDKSGGSVRSGWRSPRPHQLGHGGRHPLSGGWRMADGVRQVGRSVRFLSAKWAQRAWQPSLLQTRGGGWLIGCFKTVLKSSVPLALAAGERPPRWICPARSLAAACDRP